MRWKVSWVQIRASLVRYAPVVRSRTVCAWLVAALELALLESAACRGKKSSPNADSTSAEASASAAVPVPKAKGDPVPCPRTDLGDTLDSLSSDTEMACVRARDGRTGQWSQIAGFRSRTWRSLVRRVDSTPLGNDDAICADADMEHLMHARCEQDPHSFCCRP